MIRQYSAPWTVSSPQIVSLPHYPGVDLKEMNVVLQVGQWGVRGLVWLFRPHESSFTNVTHLNKLQTGLSLRL